MPIMAFEKRDNMGYPIHPLLITFFICLGIFALVVCAYAIHRLMGFENASRALASRSVEQDDYMRQVRSRNLDGLMAEGRRAHKMRASELR